MTEAKVTAGPWAQGGWSGECHLIHNHDQGKCQYEYRLLHGEGYWDRFISTADAERHERIVGSDDHGPHLTHADATFIVTACNACFSTNPSDPMAVAREIEAAFAILPGLIETGDLVEGRHRDVERARALLARINPDKERIDP